ncbi:GNAT family N-acetyltransferase [Actinopolymorpha cephalotaxi]|uniref:GNAT superfamily N-acetyltransferase n=1 Tax=Actinopolymorpha cephalotaxi TaxID=504797 RepID=A0ABX2S7A3_9ACTN|nr:GNAT family N-acetyltransferase [Actinopolymorpha cephalotaxi]NYH85525.1 GNAT superfamily N-acetyltransferase [Actinopolymorpha cephalotaxi]
MTNVENAATETGPVKDELTGAGAADTGANDSGVVVRQVGPDDWREWRAIRLAALEEAPWAFGSTLAQARTFVEDDWRRRLSGFPCYLAHLPEEPAVAVGMSGAYVEEPEPGEPGIDDPGSGAAEGRGATFGLVSMWVSPTARGRGVGAHLIAAVVDWAARSGAARVHLWVTDGNDPARRLYERCGFVPTGERAPLPSDPSLSEIGMVRELSA